MEYCFLCLPFLSMGQFYQLFLRYYSSQQHQYLTITFFFSFFTTLTVMNRLFSQTIPILKKASTCISNRSFSSNSLVKLHSVVPAETKPTSISLQTEVSTFEQFASDVQNNKFEVRFMSPLNDILRSNRFLFSFVFSF